MPKPSLPKDISDSIWLIDGVHAFPFGNNPKVNLIARLQFELTFYNVVVQHVSLYATGISSQPPNFGFLSILMHEFVISFYLYS